MTAASNVTDSVNRKLSYDTVPVLCAKNAPANPASVAPQRNAMILIGPVRMPMARAASSSSRIAIHARPSRDSLRWLKTSMTIATRNTISR